MGKSLFIKRLAENLGQKSEESAVCVTIPIHGPTVSSDNFTSLLSKHYATPIIIHMDIATDVSCSATG